MSRSEGPRTEFGYWSLFGRFHSDEIEAERWSSQKTLAELCWGGRVHSHCNSSSGFCHHQLRLRQLYGSGIERTRPRPAEQMIQTTQRLPLLDKHQSPGRPSTRQSARMDNPRWDTRAQVTAEQQGSGQGQTAGALTLTSSRSSCRVGTRSRNRLVVQEIPVPEPHHPVGRSSIYWVSVFEVLSSGVVFSVSLSSPAPAWTQAETGWTPVCSCGTCRVFGLQTWWREDWETQREQLEKGAGEPGPG